MKQKKNPEGTYGYGQGTPKNVIDAYREKFISEICADLDAKRSPVVAICMNLTTDFNKASVVRAANAFLIHNVVLVGEKRFDRRGTVGTHHYEHISHQPDLTFVQDLIAEGYTVFPVDNVERFAPTPVFEVALPEKSAFVFGEELKGLTEDEVQYCNGPMLYIPQYGSVRSINVAQAAAVVFYEYTRQHPTAQGPQA